MTFHVLALGETTSVIIWAGLMVIALALYLANSSRR